MTKTLIPLTAALLLLPSLAQAAPTQGEARNDEGALVDRSGEMTQIIFDKDDKVDGELFQPGGINVNSLSARAHESMIGIRGDFQPELIWLSQDI